ncbi:MAG: Mth938-like domain-containing protein [Pseudomonadota bacterium]
MTFDPAKAARGIEIHAAHFPGRAPIDAYGNGGFRFADMSHRGSILCLPSGIYDWSIAEPDAITFASLGKAVEDAGDIEILLIGLGKDIRPFQKPLRQELSEAGLPIDAMSTGAAVRTYNVLLSENRAVAAALIAVA